MDSMGWTLPKRNERRHNIGFAFGATASPFKGEARPSPVFAPFNFKKTPPAKKKKHGKAETGRGRSAGAKRRRWGGVLASPWTPMRTIWVRITTHAERAPVRL